MRGQLRLAVWLRDAGGRVRALWHVMGGPECRGRLEEVVDATYARIGALGYVLRVEDWEDARTSTLVAIGAQRCCEGGDVLDVNDATMIVYWNQLNGDAANRRFGAVPLGGFVTPAELAKRLSTHQRWRSGSSRAGRRTRSASSRKSERAARRNGS